MADQHKHLLGSLQAELNRLWGDVRVLGRSRLELAQLELSAAGRSIRRLLVVLVPAAVMGLLTLPALVVALAMALDGVLGLAGWAWLLILAGSFAACAVLACGLAYRRFRREFRGLEESLEELREDIVWFQEWFGTTPADSSLPADDESQPSHWPADDP